MIPFLLGIFFSQILLIFVLMKYISQSNDTNILLKNMLNKIIIESECKTEKLISIIGSNNSAMMVKLNNIHMDIMSTKSSSRKIEESLPAANRKHRTQEQKEKARQRMLEYWAAKKEAAISAAPIDITPK
jgi:hypothetical protein